MRGLAACYSEHAIKVSDTYCSGPSNHTYISPTLPPSIPDTVTTTYTSSSSSDKPVSVSLTWSDNLTVVISTPAKSYSVSLKKPKGSRKLTSSSGSLNAEILWDLTEAEYDNGGPEPTRGFSVAVVVNSEVVLRVGDVDRRDTSSWRVSRTERYSGSCWLSTKAKFSDAGSKHEIQIQCGGGGGGGGGGEEGYLWKQKSPETMSVWVDKRKVFQVKKLKWNFRGNQTMFFDGMLIDMMWDLHDWFFKETASSSSTGSKTTSSSSSSSSSSSPPCAVFMFRRRSGLDSRLWLEEDEEESKKIGLREAKHSFSLVICVSKK
ncbi:PREDICTED: uncharacterized protein LOC106331915 [Brassica oleracea var. oleracea]|uniref:Uncharacterized protein n=1 Tax=Brassica oleracea var. oleracea TaxID=109376 RepID=A0A0D3B588_BRAOL|nr:PREDICTED: uncharacterized protein LOC106331915 [Brassica oleracea var. oleracea]